VHDTDSGTVDAKFETTEESIEAFQRSIDDCQGCLSSMGVELIPEKSF